MAHAPTLDQTASPGSQLPQWLAVAALVYVLISAVGLIGTGFKSATGGQAEELFSFATNPFVGLVIGILATVLIQSSTSVTALIVGLVAGGLPVSIAVPMILGSNVGTTVTSTFVSLGYVRSKEEFRRAFAAATVHDFFNLIAVVIFLPLEIMFGLLERSAAAVANLFVGDSNLSMSGMNFMGMLTKPLVGTLESASNLLPGIFAGLAMVVIGLALIILAIAKISKLLKTLMVGKAKAVMHNAIGKGPVSGILSGTVVTVIVQSSSVTTSLMVPLAGAGTFTTRQIYPFTLGANIGTTLTALLAATAVSGAVAASAMQIALVHVLYNLFAVTIIFGLPFLRYLPVQGAELLAALATQRKIYAVVWILGVFVVLPLLLLAITTIF